MNFNIENYKGKYVMHCKTERESKDFCNYLHSIGRTWRSGVTYSSLSYWDIYKHSTCYDFNEGESSYKDYYKNKGFIILEWEDFMNKEFTKEDLRTGDLLKRQDGYIEMVIKEYGTLLTSDGDWNDLNGIRKDLTRYYFPEGDIIEVRRPTKAHECCFKNYDAAPIIWRKKEVEEMTLEEVCKALGKEIKIVKSK